MIGEPLTPAQARKTLSGILISDEVRFSGHCLARMAERNLTEQDVLNILRGGRCFEPAEMENGTWRYRFHTNTMGAAVAFRSESIAVVVTAWRTR